MRVTKNIIISAISGLIAVAFLSDVYAQDVLQIDEFAILSDEEVVDLAARAVDVIPEEDTVDEYVIGPSTINPTDGARNCYNAGTVNVPLSCFCTWGRRISSYSNTHPGTNVRRVGIDYYYNGFI